MTSPNERACESLLQFCDFLGLRLYTENLELLRRVIADFFATPRCFTTVDALLAVGYPTVTILPVENSDSHAVDRALSQLLRVRHGRVGPMDTDGLRDLHDALRGKVQLTHWRWLLRMYDEFCSGIQVAVTKFVTRRAAAIAVFPVPPRSIHVADNAPIQDRVVNDAETIRRAYQHVERQAPWEHVFDIATVVYPFDLQTYPGLAQRLRTFWERHARAVWERRFWPPLAEYVEIPGTEYYERKRRQGDAASSFVTAVIVPIFKTFGPTFFIELDLQRVRHHWWWYREPVVDLLKMAAAVGIDACVGYIKSQTRQRVPTLPSGFHVPTRGCGTPAPVTTSSMWSTRLKTQHIAAAIEAMMQDLETPTTVSKRRRDSEADDGQDDE